MTEQGNNHYSVLVKTTILGLLLSIIPWPNWFVVVMPIWLLLCFSYWLLFYAKRYILLSAFIIGLMTDVFIGDYFGQNAIAMVVASGALQSLKRHFLFASLLAQQFYLLVIGSIFIAVYLAVFLLLGSFDVSWHVVFAPISTAFVWLLMAWLPKPSQH